MPNLETEGSSPVELTKALLLYEGSEEVVITSHPVKKGVIQPGEPLDLAAFRKLLDRGTTATGSRSWSWQFPRMLAESPQWILWWSPAGIQSVFIGNDGCKKPQVLKAWIPGLVWCASRTTTSCYLWAYKGEGAPSQNTDVYRPAFGPQDANLNHIHSDCRICVGSTKVNGHQPADWERGFWSSKFKTPGNLKHTKPYACEKAFKHLGPLSSVLPSSKSAD